MTSTLRRILVVGGNGFIGSAVCRAALARGMQVTSISSSGQPYRTPKGHTPAWVSKVDWQKGDALSPQSFAHLFPQVGGVVHTLGTLIEDGKYKRAIQHSDIPGLVGSFFESLGVGGSGNPLQNKTPEEKKGSYEVMNRDAALAVCDAFLSTPAAPEVNNLPRPFIFVSAEDIFRPLISARYIETKREAEKQISSMMEGKSDYRPVFIRPSLVYHAHQRPLTTPPAALLDLSATLHAKVPRSIPTPSSILRSLGSSGSTSSDPFNITGSSLESVANALTTPPVHVDQVADAICVALCSSNGVRGVVNVRRMRELIGWTEDGNEQHALEKRV
ncbi:mitochondrial protein [Cyathus striatus]|nr:mitochondrial protein [Cyathus striatus]